MDVTRFPMSHLDQIRHLSQSVVKHVNDAQATYLKAMLAGRASCWLVSEQLRDFFAPMISLETVGFDLLHRPPSTEEDEREKAQFPPWRELIWPAYRLRRTLSLSIEGPTCSNHNSLDYLFEEAVDGVIAHRQPELRHRLNMIDLDVLPDGNLSWDEYLWLELQRAYVLLVRKRGVSYPEDGSLADMEKALKIIERLRRLQEGRENELLQAWKSEASSLVEWYQRRSQLARIVAMYHVARALEITGLYLAGQAEKISPGRTLSDRGVKDEIDRFISNARDCLRGIDPDLNSKVQRLSAACKALVDASIYAQQLPRPVKQFVVGLSSLRAKPLNELWYSQRQALQGNLMDPTRSAVVVSMPTSAGKTLLAEMAMIQALADEPNARVVYLAPTRALITQVSLTLRRDFGRCPEARHLRVRVATPAFELDPIEEKLLEGEYHVLVTTPEKLDLLVRINHPSVQRLSLVVVDEAHNLQDPGRGARLELLLAMLRRERADLRFLLLTPFASNAPELARWLGGEREAHIMVDWKPNDRVVGLISTECTGKGGWRLTYTTLETVRSDFPAGVELSFGTGLPRRMKRTKREITIRAAVEWARQCEGGVLVLAMSRTDAEERAKEIARLLANPGAERKHRIDLVCRYIETETGGPHPLAELLRRGVAFHHAGLSPKARYLVERLVESRDIPIICATTTLAQGVNFPLSVAIIEGTARRVRKGGLFSVEEVPPYELWNIAGRVGRTMEDTLGTVAFVVAEEQQLNKVREYLKKDEREVRSSLLQLIELFRSPYVKFDINHLERYPALSPLLQYILHAVRLEGAEGVLNNAEGLLRSSFLYAEIQKLGNHIADDVVRAMRSYVGELIAAKKGALQGYASLADGTGFSSISIDRLWQQWRGRTNSAEWNPEHLFRDPGSILVRIIETLGAIPEIRLGSYEEGGFSPPRLARIARAWVGGESIYSIARAEYGGDVLDCTRHIYGTIVPLLPWGLQTIEKVAFSGDESVDWEVLSLIPAMVLHGVRSREAIALSMVEVPRFAAEGLGRIWEQAGRPLEELDVWLEERSETDWQKALPVGARISGSESKRLWELFTGRRTWEEV